MSNINSCIFMIYRSRAASVHPLCVTVIIMGGGANNDILVISNSP